jgi:hypothetical protein
MKKRNLLHFILKIRGLIAGGLFGKWAMIMVLTAIVAVFFNACEKFEDTPAIYKQEPVSNTGDPSITGIQPAAIAKGGVREITILGHNLGVRGTDTNWVFIGGKRAKIKEVADDHIIVYRPMLEQSNYDKKIYINVTNPKAIDTSSRAAYTVETTGLFVQDYSFGTSSYVAFESDINDNFYVLGDNKNIYFIGFAGAGAPSAPFLGGLSADLKVTTDMKLGPGSNKVNLYFACGKKDINRIMTDTAVSSKANNITKVIISLPTNITKIDFDPDGNMYAGGSGGIYFVKRNSDNTFSEYLSCGFGNLNLKGILVSKNKDFVYVADSLHVWKNAISADGTLGEKTELVNIQNNPELSTFKITSFVLDEKGGLYLCIQGNPKYSLYFVESAQSIVPYYNDANLIPGQYTESLVWGNGRYLYLTKGSVNIPGTKTRKPADDIKNRVYRLYMDKNGAVYNGRKFNQ